MQLSLLPKEIPSIPGLDLYCYSQAAAEVGGDFCGFVTHPGQPLTFFIGDACGMGLPAALLMAMARSQLRAEAERMPVPSPETILRYTNKKLLADYLEAGVFATAFVGQYEPESHRLVYANAGHSPVIFCRAGGEASLLEADGIPLGVLKENLSNDQCILLKEGDILVIATDGLYETRSPLGESFGIDRLVARVQQLANLPAEELIARLVQEIWLFSALELQVDDQTLVVLRCTG